MKLEITGTGNGFGLRLIPETETEAELFRDLRKLEPFASVELEVPRRRKKADGK